MCINHQILSGDEIKRMSVTGHVAGMGEKSYTYRTSVGKPKQKRERERERTSKT
jgi:hypothetical protein